LTSACKRVHLRTFIPACMRSRGCANAQSSKQLHTRSFIPLPLYFANDTGVIVETLLAHSHTRLHMRALLFRYGFIQTTDAALDKAKRAAAIARSKPVKPGDQPVPPEDASPVDLVVWHYLADGGLRPQLEMLKTVDWDWQTTVAAVQAYLRPQYRHDLVVEPYFEQTRVIIKAPTALNHINSNTCTNIFCCVTCLCIFWWPFLQCVKRKHKGFESHFRVGISAEEFLRRNLDSFTFHT
jgi:hypothetical protein